MNSIDRVKAAINDENIDRLPMGFWYHFDPATYGSIEDTVKVHEAYFNETQMDILKIMNENLFPYDVKIEKPSDFRRIETPTAKSKFIVQQKETVKRIVDKLGDKAFLLMTLHGTMASAWHARGGSDGYSEGSFLLADYIREDGASMEELFKKITEAMNILMHEVKDSGIEGIYYSALGGESYLVTDEEYAKFIKPYDYDMNKTADELFDYNFFHICKDVVNLERFKDMPGKVFNWGEHHDNPSLEEGAKIFEGKAILGGFDNSQGVIVNGTKEELKAHLVGVKERMKNTKFLVGADCTLPSNIDLQQIRNIREILEEIK